MEMPFTRTLFVGPPGSGKGTQGKLLTSEPYRLKHISTGDIIRTGIEMKLPLFKSLQEEIAQGILSPNNLIYNIVNSQIRDLRDHNGLIIDGGVRTLEQAEYGVRMHWFDSAFHFHVEYDELVRRLVNRYGADGRSDDNPDTIPNRLDTYRRQTEPILGYLRNKGIPITKINAHRPGMSTEESIARVHGEVLSALGIK